MNPTPEQQRFAEIIDDVLKITDLTVGELAERIGVYRGTVNNWLGRGTKWIDIEKMTISAVEAIARIKGCSTDELMAIVRGNDLKHPNAPLTAVEIAERLTYHLGEAQRLARHLQMSSPLEIDVVALQNIASQYLEMAGHRLDSTEGVQAIATTAGPQVFSPERVQQILVGCDVSYADVIHLARVFRVFSQSDQPSAEDVYQRICLENSVSSCDDNEHPDDSH